MPEAPKHIMIHLILLLFIFSGRVAAQESVPPYPDGTISGNVFSQTEEDYMALLVEKSSETLFIIDVRNNIPSVSRYYGVVTARFNGDKVKEGDQRTPEGIYFISGYIPQERLDAALYGIGAFPITYPNIVDKINGKTGHGIWIHGRGSLTNGRRTKGCISLQNQDFKYLKRLISENTPVIISERVEFFRPDVYEEQKLQYINYLKGFISAWERGDFKIFSGYFDPRFKNDSGLSYRSYLSKKKRLMELYPHRRIIISDIRVFKENSTELMYQFSQLYCTNNMLSFGTKRLYLDSDDSGEYRVIAEEFSESPPNPYLERSIRDFISQWRESWESLDFDRYISFYGDTFTNGRMNLKEWKIYKENLFNSTRIKEIEIKDIKLKILSPKRIRVTFEQRYSSESLTDRGIKTLILSGCPGEYKIISEFWRPL